MIKNTNLFTHIILTFQGRTFDIPDPFPGIAELSRVIFLDLAISQKFLTFLQNNLKVSKRR